MSKKIRLNTKDGVVDQNDLLEYDTHARAKNWIATVTTDRSKPGGLKREFWDRARSSFYRVPDIVMGTIIEVGSDYYTGSGKKRPSRAYFRVIGEERHVLHLEKWEKPE